MNNFVQKFILFGKKKSCQKQNFINFSPKHLKTLLYNSEIKSYGLEVISCISS